MPRRLTRATGGLLVALVLPGAAAPRLRSVGRQTAAMNDTIAGDVDVSPDGRTLVFELGGDLFTMPVAGGAAQALMRGTGTDHHPRWSRDGRRIAFVRGSDGRDNVWLVAVSSRKAAPLTRDTLRRSITSLDWSVDGTEIAEAFGSSAPGFDIVSLDGERQQYTVEPNGVAGQRSVTRALFAPDGRSLFLGRDGSVARERQVTRYDRLLRHERAITQSVTGAIDPAISRDGHTLAFVTKMDSARTEFVVRRPEEAVEHTARVKLERARPKSGAGEERNVYALTRDGTTLIVADQGMFRRVEVGTGRERKSVYRLPRRD